MLPGFSLLRLLRAVLELFERFGSGCSELDGKL